MSDDSFLPETIAPISAPVVTESKKRSLSVSSDLINNNQPRKVQYTNFEDIPAISSPVVSPSPLLSTPFSGEHETKANEVLDDNLKVINGMRENLVAGKIKENLELMKQFYNNVTLVTQL
jgi:hypothetical protein